MNYILDLPKIETERLILRGWKENDFETLAEVYADEDHVKYFGGAKPRWQAWRHFASIIGHYNLRGFTFFAVEEKQSNQMIGWVGPWHPEGWPEQELGYILKRSANGKGFALEAAKAALGYIYNQLGWKTAISQIDEKNYPSKKLAKKLGASFEKNALLFDEHKSEVWRHLPPQQFMEMHA